MGRARASLVAVTALLCALVMAGAPKGFAADLVLLTQAQAKPWRAVGRVNVSHVRMRSLCTGALIAPDIVLTAAHCVVNWRTGQPFPVGDIHFVTGWHKGQKTGHSKASALAVHPDFKTGQKKRVEQIAGDIALIRLTTPMSDESAAPFGVAAPPLPGEPLTIVSYRRDRPHVLTYQGDCPYGAIAGSVLSIDCPVIMGASGSPVFGETVADRQQVVAVVVARRDGPPSKAYAVRADKAVEMLRATLP